MARLNLFEPHTCNINDLIKASFMVTDVWLEEEEEISVTGLVIVENVKEFSLYHITVLSPVCVKIMVTLIQVFCLTFSAWSLSMNKSVVHSRIKK